MLYCAPLPPWVHAPPQPPGDNTLQPALLPPSPRAQATHALAFLSLALPPRNRATRTGGDAPLFCCGGDSNCAKWVLKPWNWANTGPAGMATRRTSLSHSRKSSSPELCCDFRKSASHHIDLCFDLMLSLYTKHIRCVKQAQNQCGFQPYLGFGRTSFSPAWRNEADVRNSVVPSNPHSKAWPFNTKHSLQIGPKRRQPRPSTPEVRAYLVSTSSPAKRRDACPPVRRSRPISPGALGADVGAVGGRGPEVGALVARPRRALQRLRRRPRRFVAGLAGSLGAMPLALGCIPLGGGGAWRGPSRRAIFAQRGARGPSSRARFRGTTQRSVWMSGSSSPDRPQIDPPNLVAATLQRVAASFPETTTLKLAKTKRKCGSVGKLLGWV